MTTVPSFRFAVDPARNESALEAGRLLFARGASFVRGVSSIDQLPPPDRPEICFAGRSNVGKSSLINALTGQKNLARASNTPGRTQELNFFNIADRLYLVDLPGYGYAEAPKALVDRWQALLRDYLRGRAGLRRAFVLIDSRHGLKDVDHEIMDLLDRAAVSFQVVLTKTDKPRGADMAKTLAGLDAGLSRHSAVYPQVLTTSSETGHGVAALRAEILELLG